VERSLYVHSRFLYLRLCVKYSFKISQSQDRISILRHYLKRIMNTGPNADIYVQMVYVLLSFIRFLIKTLQY